MVIVNALFYTNVILKNLSKLYTYYMARFIICGVGVCVLVILYYLIGIYV